MKAKGKFVLKNLKLNDYIIIESFELENSKYNSNLFFKIPEEYIENIRNWYKQVLYCQERLNKLERIFDIELFDITDEIIDNSGFKILLEFKNCLFCEFYEDNCTIYCDYYLFNSDNLKGTITDYKIENIEYYHPNSSLYELIKPYKKSYLLNEDDLYIYDDPDDEYHDEYDDE